MGKRTVSLQMPLVQAFHGRTSTIYYSMRNRFAEKRDKNGRLRRHGMEVPFSLDDFREWVLAGLGGKPDGCALCAYCRCPLCSQDFRVDHVVPPMRGGSLALDNLAIACDTCNRAKGQLTAEEYAELRDALDVLLRTGKIGPEGYKDIWKRLKGGTALLARAQIAKARQPFLEMPPPQLVP